MHANYLAWYMTQSRGESTLTAINMKIKGPGPLLSFLFPLHGSFAEPMPGSRICFIWSNACCFYWDMVGLFHNVALPEPHPTFLSICGIFAYLCFWSGLVGALTVTQWGTPGFLLQGSMCLLPATFYLLLLGADPAVSCSAITWDLPTPSIAFLTELTFHELHFCYCNENQVLIWNHPAWLSSY